jgi:hypothetical protein
LLTIRGAHIWGVTFGQGSSIKQRDLHMSNVILLERGRDADVIDLDGCTIFPALINAHDHLELNHYPRTKFRDKYDNAHQWGEDVSARLEDEPFKSLRAYPLEDRCFIGGLKNLLCGALTVAHHNPPHKCLFKADFPVRVLRRYGWAHSLHFTPEAEIVRSYRATPPDVPWFIHLAEGTDDIAAGEYQRLKALGCVGKNTVIVHGVGISYEDALDAVSVFGIGLGENFGFMRLVWCPSTNDYLLNSMIYGRILAMAARTMIGSDSRLTADGDLLDEMRVAWEKAPFADEHKLDFILSSVTYTAKRALKLHDVGNIALEHQADVIAIRAVEDAEYTLCHARRADLALVVRGGVPQIGDPDVMTKFPAIQTIPATLDGKPKRIERRLAAQIARCTLRERGLELDPDFVQAEQKKKRGILFKRE